MYCIKKCDIPANLDSVEIAVMDNRVWGCECVSYAHTPTSGTYHGKYQRPRIYRVDEELTSININNHI